MKTKEQIINMMNIVVINLHKPENSYGHNSWRLLGLLEGLLVLIGKIQYPGTLPYKSETVETYSIWHGKGEKVIQEDYRTMILRLVHEVTLENIQTKQDGK